MITIGMKIRFKPSGETDNNFYPERRNHRVTGTVTHVSRHLCAVSLQNDSRALELYRSGASDREIADATGWGKSTVAKWRRDNGLPCNRTATPLMDREADAVRLYGQGLSDGAIARSIGCSAYAVFHWRRRTGRPANRRPGWQKGRTRKGENHEQETQAK